MTGKKNRHDPIDYFWFELKQKVEAQKRLKKMKEMQDDEKIPIYEGMNYLVEYGGGLNDYPSRWKELRGEHVIDFLEELNGNRDVSEIKVFQAHELSDDEARKNEDETVIFLITYTHVHSRLGLRKIYSKMVGHHVRWQLDRWRGEEAEGKIDNVQLRRLELVAEHSINWFFRDFAKHVKNLDYSTIKKLG